MRSGKKKSHKFYLVNILIIIKRLKGHMKEIAKIWKERKKKIMVSESFILSFQTDSISVSKFTPVKIWDWNNPYFWMNA